MTKNTTNFDLSEAAYINKGMDAYEAGDLDSAQSLYESGLVYFPMSASLWTNLSVVLNQKKDFARAESVIAQSIELIGSSTCYNNLGILKSRQGLYSEAEAAYKRAVALQPNYTSALNNLGLLYLENREFAKSESCYKRSMMIDPVKFDYYKFSELYLMQGDYKRGFEYYEHRLSEGTPLVTTRQRLNRMPDKRWDGQPVQNLVVINEQGFGDSLMMMRYMARVRRYAESVIVFCTPALERLYQHLGFTTTSNFDDVVDCDAYVCTMSFPYLFGIVSPDKVAGGRYLEMPVPERKSSSRLSIGVCWSGNPANTNDRVRSVSLSALKPLFDLDADFVSLALGKPEPSIFVRSIEDCKDFYDTACFIQSRVDVVVTVDTAIAHLAGALGKPVILLNRYTSEWRWGTNKTTSCWYDSMLILTQLQRGDWSGVVDAAVTELKHRYPNLL